jgi:hypothetical protein
LASGGLMLLQSRHVPKGSFLKMKLKLMGRAALLLCASVVVGLGLSSCASSTLGYLFVTSTQYGEVSSLRLDINSGAIKGVSCETHNSNQQNCNVSSNGAYPTKLVTAQGNTLMYVLNSAQNGAQGSVSVLTMGDSGQVYDTGLVYTPYGQNPIDMYLNPAGTYLYVLTQYASPSYSPSCADTPGTTVPSDPSTCPAAITAFSIAAKGYLSPVLCNPGEGESCPNNDFNEFVINYEAGPLNPGYGGNRMIESGGYLYILDEKSPAVGSTPAVPEINSRLIETDGSLSVSLTSGNATTNPAFVSLSSIASGSFIYVADSGTGLIYTFTANSNGSLNTGTGTGSFCYSLLTGDPKTSDCTLSPVAQTGTNLPVLLDALYVSGNYLYAADYNNGTIFSFLYTGTGTYGVTTTSNGGYTELGTNVTCITESSGTPFLYVSGNGNVSGEQVDPNTGNLSTHDHTTTVANFAGLVPCVVFSSRT